MRAQLRVGRDQLGAFGEQLLLALLQPLQRLTGVREVCLFHLERLLGLCDALAFARDPSLHQARSLLRLRQLLLLAGELAPGSLPSVARLLATRLAGTQRLALRELAAQGAL